MREEAAFSVLEPPEGITVPMVAHVPHPSRHIPSDLASTLLLDRTELEAELLAMTDAYTDELAADVLDLGGVMFVNGVSRLVVDPERFPDPDRETMEAVGMGAVYTRTSGGRPLRTPADRDELLARFFEPYAAAFTGVVDRMLETFGSCTIVDVHSYPSQPLPYELPPVQPRPSICLGTDPFHTPAPMIERAEAACAERGLDTARDVPFAGTYVPLRHYRQDPRVSSLMVEVRRDLYMDEATGARSDFAAARGHVRAILEAIRG
ncbi:MAG TPA: N-formylglutamate amidohydrolase [Actinomycetota bacterium]|nr:N-formylglutamate amidohydrolase [Actinomycetota bacterium]